MSTVIRDEAASSGILAPLHNFVLGILGVVEVGVEGRGRVGEGHGLQQVGVAVGGSGWGGWGLHLCLPGVRVQICRGGRRLRRRGGGGGGGGGGLPAAPCTGIMGLGVCSWFQASVH